MKKEPKKEKDIFDDKLTPPPKKSNKLRKYLLMIVIAIALYSILVNIPEKISERGKAPTKKRKGFQIKSLLQLKAKHSLAIPKIAGKIPLGGNVQHQWKSYRSRFVLIQKNNVPIYVKPSFSADVIGKLNMSERVRIVFLSPEMVEYGEQKGRWAFVMDEMSKEPIGWILDNNVVYKNSFKPVKEEWYFNSIIFRKGRYFAKYSVTEQGKFTATWAASGKGIYLQGKTKGNIYQYNDLIWAKKKRSDGFYDFFYLDEAGKLHVEQKFKKSLLSTDI
ncbi:hypothetical protein ACFLZV_01815 [Candidatus Margulisiibacteriota bacterium]